MSTVYRIDEQGGFVVADTAQKITSYAEPGSRYAVWASRPGQAKHTAEAMLAMEEKWSDRTGPNLAIADKVAMDSLMRGVCDGSTVALAPDSMQREIRKAIRDEMRHGLFDVHAPPHEGYNPLKAGSASLYDSYRASVIRDIREEMGAPRQSR